MYLLFGGKPGVGTGGKLAADASGIIVSGIGNFVDFNVVFGEVFINPLGTEDVQGFIVSNRCFDFTAIPPDKDVAV